MPILIIVGNGFDLYHDLPTKYDDYRRFLGANHKQLLDEYNEFPFLCESKVERWSDVEESLTLAYEECLEAALASYPLDLRADNPGWNDPAIWVEAQTGFIKDFTGEIFFRWLLSVDVAQAKNEVLFPGDSVFVTFNYTTTLEDRYGIPDTRIFHIHGSVKDVDGSVLLQADYGTVPDCWIPDDWDGMDVEICRDEYNQALVSSTIQFGSPQNDPIRVREDLETEYGDEEFYGAMVEPCVASLEHFSKAAGKRLADNYLELKNRIEQWRIDGVCVFGHSFNGVDRPYYDDIFLSILGKLPWAFVVYDEESVREVENFCHEVGIEEYSTLLDKGVDIVDLREVCC